MMFNNSISCIIPTFNRVSLLKEAINSILHQTFTDWELIIVDNGSTDNTVEIVNEYLKIDERIRYSKCTTKGPAAARNFGVSQAKGEYIVFLDDDDISLPHRFKTQLEAVKETGKEFVVSGYEVRDRLNNKLIERKINELKGYGAGFPSRWIISKKLFEKVEGFDEDKELIAMEDPEFSYRVAQYEIFASHASVVTIMYPSLDSISRGGKNLKAKERMMEKSAPLMHPVEAGSWYYTIAQTHYSLGDFIEAGKYFKLALANDRRTYIKIALLYLNLSRWISGITVIKKINLKIFSLLVKNKFPKLVGHPVVN